MKKLRALVQIACLFLKIKNTRAGDQLRLGANTHVLLYSKSGEMINPDTFTGLADLSLDKEKLGEIKETTVESSFGMSEDYRYITIGLATDELGYYSSYDIKYATILVNVSQIKSSIESYEATVAIVMVSAWLISILASIYLSNLSMRPILISYQKQKTSLKMLVMSYAHRWQFFKIAWKVYFVIPRQLFWKVVKASDLV